MRNAPVALVKQNLDLRPGDAANGSDMTAKVMIPLFSLFAELERDLVSLRTKEALAAKKALGVRLDKPKASSRPASSTRTSRAAWSCSNSATRCARSPAC
jgi:DNA invertase Pin-like site-specific DNA recombinase